MLFVCPKCKRKLEILNTSAACSLGHSYDRAKGGYYNLLLSQSKGIHGDNREMILARRAFLSTGAYAPLAEAIAEVLLTSTERLPAVLDAGCGEGYYTDIIERALAARDGESRVSGFDISKDAVREAAKKNKRLSLAVAGSYRMPIEDGSVDALVNVFSPLAISETRRVLCEGGLFIMAIPDEEHLFELKEILYDTPYKNTVENTVPEGFFAVSEKRLRYTVFLDTKEKIASLFMMTPYAYRTRPENAKRIDSLTSLSVTADFRILIYRKSFACLDKSEYMC